MELTPSFYDVAKFIGAFTLVMALIFVFGWALRRWGGRLHGMKVREFSEFMLQVRVIDPQRKLLKIRDEEGEYLILTGPHQDLLLREKNLQERKGEK